MKTLHLLGTSAYLPWSIGGSIIFCHRLCQNLQTLGIQVLVAIHQHYSGREPLGEHIYEGVPVIVLPPIPDSNERIPIYSRVTKDAVGFEKLLTEYKADIVHFHDFTAEAGITHMQLAKKAACKVVMTYHTQGNSCSQHGLLYQGKQVCDGQILLQRCSECRLSVAGLPPLLGKLPALWSPTWLNAEDSNKLSRVLTTRQMTEVFRNSWQQMLDLVDALHVHANWVENIVKLNGCPSEKIHFFRTAGPNPIQSQKKELLKDGLLRIAFVGRSTIIKGMHVLVEAVKLLPTQLPIKVTCFYSEVNFEEQEYGFQLQKRLEEDARFEVKYGVPNNELLSLLANYYDVSVVPSLWLETGPLTVLEAFAAGLPVIGSRLGGIAELVQDGIDGLLFEPGNSQELARIIQRLLEEPSLLQQLQNNVKAPRNMSDLAKDTLEMYKELCSTYVV
jgi:glycosyltransferase involved in cell wall biosynthesis